jgi:hypothetical protein
VRLVDGALDPTLGVDCLEAQPVAGPESPVAGAGSQSSVVIRVLIADDEPRVTMLTSRTEDD